MKLTIFSLMFSLFLSIGAFADADVREDDQKGIGSIVFLLNPAKVKIETDYELEGMVNLINEIRDRALNGELTSIGVNTGFMEMDVKDDKAKLTLFSSSLGALKKAVKIKIKPISKDDKRLEMKVRLKFCQVRDLYEESKDEGDVSRWRFSGDLEDELKRLFAL